MAFDAAQILRQTYAAGAEAMQMREMAESQLAQPATVSRGELMGTSVVMEADPMAELMDSMEELSFQFEEKTAKRVSERRMGPVQGSRASFIRALEAWQSLMPDMPGNDKLKKTIQSFREMLRTGNFSGSGASALLRVLARESTDASHQFAMLEIGRASCRERV